MNANVDLLMNNYGTSDLTGVDVLKIGEGLLNWIGTTVTLGHTRPGHVLDYAQWSGGALWNDSVRDFVAWTSGRFQKAPSCDVRLTNLIRESGWQRFQMEQAARTLGLGA